MGMPLEYARQKTSSYGPPLNNRAFGLWQLAYKSSQLFMAPTHCDYIDDFLYMRPGGVETSLRQETIVNLHRLSGRKYQL